MKVKLQRGQKLCPHCEEINASRQRVCKYCDREFISKNTPIKGEVKDWQQLEKGTFIKVVQGTGPYYISKRDSEDSRAGERICMGITGVYNVVGVSEKGILAYGASLKNGGFTFIYMGPSTLSTVTGTYLEAHRIKRVKRKKKPGDKNASNSNSGNHK
jgi:hypothetical protein